MNPLPTHGLKPGLLSACLFLASFSTLGLEVALARVLAVLLSPPYAYLVLAMAMLGIGLGGAVGYTLDRHQAAEELDRCRSVRQALAFALSVPAAVLLLPASARAPGDDGTVLLIMPVACAPFVAAGVLMSGLYRYRAEASHRLYALDLMGAGAGAWGAVLLLDGFGGIGAGVLSAAGAGLSAILLCLGARPHPKGLLRAGTGALLLSLALGGAARDTRWFDLPPGRNSGKEIHDALHAFGGEIAATRWTAFGRTDLVRYPGRPDGMDLYLDGTAGSPLYRFSGRPEDLDRAVASEMADFPGSFALRSLPPEARRSALVIGPGGGRDVLLALWAGFEQITAVEVNPDVVDLVREQAAFSGGIYAGHPRVDVRVDEGRRFIRSRGERFDLIFLSLPVINTTRSLEGYALTESFLFTRESMSDYWGRLTPGGSLVVVAHNDAEILRLVVLALETLQADGRAAPEGMRHLALTGDGEYRSLTLRRRAFSAAESRAMSRAARGMGYPPHASFFPGATGGHPRLGELSTGRIGPDDLVREVRALGWDISPVTDNRPFFYKLEVGWPAPMLYAAVAGLALLLLVAAGAAMARRAGGGDRPPGTAVALAFGLFGAGFMMLEMGLLSRFFMLFGSPAAAMAFFLSTLLGWAGLGSWIGARHHPDAPGRRLQQGSLVTALVLMAYAAGFTWCFDRVQALPDGLRPAGAALLLMPAGLCAGVPFPAGLSWLKTAGLGDRIPWMYALNGTAAVVGSIVSLWIATRFGYREVLAAAAVCYLCCALLAAAACEPGRNGLRVQRPGSRASASDRAALHRGAPDG